MSNFKLGPVQITIGGNDMGKTEGGVTVALTESSVPLHTDQDGETPVDEIITGTSITVTGNLAENTLDNIATLAKTSVVSDASDPQKQKVEVGANVGYSLFANAVEVVLKPYDGGVVSTNANDWLTIPKAGIKFNGNLQYDLKTQRVIGFTITGYPDANGVLAIFGDMTATP